jgi:hypothetical protein
LAIKNLEIMKFLHENGAPWTRHMFSKAARHGDLETMKWLYDKGCPWSEFTFEKAAGHGDLVNMQWLYEKGCPWGFASKQRLQGIFYYIQEPIIQWMQAHGCPKA